MKSSLPFLIVNITLGNIPFSLPEDVRPASYKSNSGTDTLHSQINTTIINKHGLRYKFSLGGILYDRNIAGNPGEYTRC